MSQGGWEQVRLAIGCDEHAWREVLRVVTRAYTAAVRGGAAGLGLKGGLHLLTAALRNVRPPKKSIGKHQVTLREAVLDVATYTVFLGTMGAVYVSVEEALALLFGQDR
ncbi:TMEM135_C_rich domain-containing protein [Haematococcus lacustris]|uniref:TMEM135_C_rich domain-containing protein n=1 Tax=Haematococcus lacustris TaxID=44745 RepID=A0A699YH08_HAELA|nr:TMEM135_C_rich domain-containing protein [Haematococcus lacustris]